MFRTAEGAGVRKVYLTGYTPDPVNRFGFPQKEIAKSALGAEQIVPWEHVRQCSRLIDRLKAEGYTIIALEQDDTSIDYRTVRGNHIAIMVGNEVAGIPRPLLQRVDRIVEIPMHGQKESLNVSTAFGIALFRMVQR
jgi:tRNA G18 (ribose-2'-O)-methylase SpoU